MYQLLEDVLPWLLGFYVFDSFVFPVAGERIFARPARTFALHRGPLLAGLWPWAEVVCAAELPVRFTPEALHWPGPDGFAPVPWETLGPLERTDRTLRAAGRTLRLPSPEEARHLADTLVRLRDAPAGSRAQEIEKALLDRFDLAEARRLREASRRDAPIRGGLGLALLLGLFGLLPLGLGGRLAAAPDPASVVVGSFVVYLVILGLGFRALRTAGLGAPAALAVLSHAFFLPAAAAHSGAFLFRRLYARLDPLTVAALLLPEPSFRRAARERFHRLRREAREGLAPHARLEEAAWTRLIEASGRSPAEVLGPPATSDPDAARYCPLCSTEHRLPFTTCSDCAADLLPLTPH